MIRAMRYRLALDIGTTSLGWCLLRLTPDNSPYAIIKMGVRIFPEGRVAKTGESLAVTRRTARLHRRRRDRLLKRKAAMERALIHFGFWPSEDDARHALSGLDPYVLRAKGLDEALTPAEFGRAVFHLNQRRGFKSNRKTDKADNDSGALKGAIKALKNNLAEQGLRTVGEWLAKRHTKREGTRARLRNGGTKDKAYDLYIDRSMIEAEFDWLWRSQAVYNPALYSTAAYEKLKDVLLFQRPLKPVNPGRCTLMPELERAPQALPSTQRFRVLQELNNLRPLNDDMTLAPLTLSQRDTLLNVLECKKSLTFKDMVKLLQLPRGTQFNLQDAKREFLKGNATTVILQDAKAFGQAWHGFSHSLQDDIVLQLLHEENEATLIAWLIANTGVTEAQASDIANTNLPEGYGNLSQEAVLRILTPLTEQVITYDKAVLAAGFDSHSDLAANRDGVVYDELPYYGQALERAVGFGSGIATDPDDKRYGRIANPTVHIGLNQVRRVVNAIIKAYGHPSEVVLEVTRDLKISKQRQQDIQKEQKLNQDRNFYNVREGCQVLGLNPDNLDKSKRRSIAQKVQLWKELNWQDPLNRFCPYTGERISIELLLSSQVEIEHILPYSRTFDDTLHNKTVAMVKANRDKGNQTPFEAFGQNQRGYDYEAILERTRTMPANKRKRFAPDGYEQWLGKEGGDFMARALNDTAYLSKVAREYVQLICPGTNTVRAIPGRMTALIRGKFGLNELLSGDETKNRNDHRHHALDAAVIGITDTAMLQKFSRASASARDKSMDKLLDKLAYPWESYRQHVERGLEGITVSFKPDHSYEGAMHEDTAWGLLGDGKVTKRVVKEGDTTRSRTTATKAVIEINSTQNRTRHGVDQNGVPLPYKGYVGGSNDCIEIWLNEKASGRERSLARGRRIKRCASWGRLRVIKNYGILR
jgi:CRISPR-associated endonuclease Csn1